MGTISDAILDFLGLGHILCPLPRLVGLALAQLRPIPGLGSVVSRCPSLVRASWTGFGYTSPLGAMPELAVLANFSSSVCCDGENSLFSERRRTHNTNFGFGSWLQADSTPAYFFDRRIYYKHAILLSQGCNLIHHVNVEATPCLSFLPI